MILSALALVAALSGNLAVADTHYFELATRFSAGTAATIDRSVGWTSGRCYAGNNQDLAQGNLLVVETRASDGRDGPIFGQPRTKLLIINHTDSVAHPDMFDNPSPELTQGLTEFIDQAFAQNNFTDVFAGDNALSGVFNNGVTLTRYDVRTDGQYWYARASDASSGAELAYCYFYNKVR